jgi:hypothetical protein
MIVIVPMIGSDAFKGSVTVMLKRLLKRTVVPTTVGTISMSIMLTSHMVLDVIVERTVRMKCVKKLVFIPR